jgi:hypothetical protein
MFRGLCIDYLPMPLSMKPDSELDIATCAHVHHIERFLRLPLGFVVVPGEGD